MCGGRGKGAGEEDLGGVVAVARSNPHDDGRHGRLLKDPPRCDVGDRDWLTINRVTVSHRSEHHQQLLEQRPAAETLDEPESRFGPNKIEEPIS